MKDARFEAAQFANSIVASINLSPPQRHCRVQFAQQSIVPKPASHARWHCEIPDLLRQELRKAKGQEIGLEPSGRSLAACHCLGEVLAARPDRLDLRTGIARLASGFGERDSNQRCEPRTGSNPPDAARKLRAVQLSDHFQAILGCLLGEERTTPRVIEMVITPDVHVLGRSEGETSFKAFRRRSKRIGCTSCLVR
jgi:hypothetical protein